MIFESSFISDLICVKVAQEIIGGFNICDEGQVKDTIGECITAHKFRSPKEDVDVKKRDIKKPFRSRNLREYLRSKYRFQCLQR